MRNLKILLIVLSFIGTLAYYSCDDSGVEPNNVLKGQVRFLQSFLKPLPDLDGLQYYYELWLRIDSLGSIYYSLGKFDVTEDGRMLELSTGEPIVFRFQNQADTTKLDSAAHVILTVEIGQGSGAPSNRRLLSGDVTIRSDSIVSSMTLGGSEALGSVGMTLLTDYSGNYILDAPTSNPSDCKKGVWFCDSLGSPFLPLGINMPVGLGWKYEGWLEDRTNPNDTIYYTTGKFRNVNQQDEDLEGPCKGPGNSNYQAPGQDWIQTGGNCPAFSTLTTGKFGVFITIEPADETGTQGVASPFVFKMYYQPLTHVTVSCKREDYLFNQYPTFPRAYFAMTN